MDVSPMIFDRIDQNNFTDDELKIVIPAIMRVKNEMAVKSRTSSESKQDVEGEVYTRLRTELRNTIPRLFRSGKMRINKHREHSLWRMIENIMNDIEPADTDKINCRMLLLDMRNSLNTTKGIILSAERINKESDRTIEGIKKLNDKLNDRRTTP